MENITIWLLTAGLMISAGLFSRTERGKKFGHWIWVAALFLVFSLNHLARRIGRAAEEPTRDENLTVESPSNTERAQATVLIEESRIAKEQPAGDLEEFRRRAKEDGL